MSHFWLIKSVEAEGLGRGGVVTPAFRNVQVAVILDDRDDGSADGGQVGGPVAGSAGGMVFAERRIPYILSGSRRHKWDVFTDRPGTAMINYSPSPRDVLHTWQVPAG